jgi:predicted HicB family RNase H-like nuclease
MIKRQLKTTTIGIRTTPTLRTAAERAAQKEDRTLSQWIEHAMRAALERENGGAAERRST